MGDTTSDLPKAGDHPDPNVPSAPGDPPSQPSSDGDHPLIKGEVTHKETLAPEGAKPGKHHHKCPEGSKSTTWHFDGYFHRICRREVQQGCPDLRFQYFGKADERQYQDR